MRLQVDGGGYAAAREAFETANHVAALIHDSLAGKLGGFAGMAGHDESSAEFAAAYDAAAGDALGALGDLVDAFAALGHLTAASLANHRDANVASIFSGAHVYEGASLPDGDYVAVLATTAPSALGVSSAPPLPFPMGLVADLVDGFIWPSADVPRLRDAGHAWRTTAEALDQLRDHTTTAARGLADQRSPEIPVALDAIADLESTVGDLVTQLSALASACDNYANSVESKRQELVDLGQELLRILAEEAIFAIGLGLVTSGIGTVAKGGTAVARIAAHAPRFAAVIGALRTAAAAAAASLTTTRAVLRTARDRLARFAAAVQRRSVALGEGGHLTLAVARRRRKPGWLRAHEHSGSHTIKHHVGKTDDELRERFVEKPTLQESSTFTDQDTAEKAIGRLLDSRDQTIQRWLSEGKGGKLELDGDSGSVIGRTMAADGSVVEARALRTVLLTDAKMPEGFRILTSFPHP